MKKKVMKNHRKVKMFLLAALCLLLAMPMPVSAASASIKLNISKKTLTVGSSVKLKATVTGESRTVTWKSSNSAIATVSKSGKVTAKKAGKATITARANGKTAKCVITIRKNTKDLSVYLGKKASRIRQAIPKLKKFDSRSVDTYTDVYYGINGKSDSNLLVTTSDNYDGKGENVSLIVIRGTCKYKLFGLSIGISGSEAQKIMEKNGWTLALTYPKQRGWDYKKGKRSVSISQSSGKVSAVYAYNG